MKVKEEVTKIYVAEDGKEFFWEFQCESYERGLEKKARLKSLKETFKLQRCGMHEIIFCTNEKDAKEYLAYQMNERDIHYSIQFDYGVKDKWCYVHFEIDSVYDENEVVIYVTPILNLIESVDKMKNVMGMEYQISML